MELSRRKLLAGMGSLGAGLLVYRSLGAAGLSRTARGRSFPDEEKVGMGGEVTAAEDLMREHGVLRRVLFVYSEAAVRLRADPSTVPGDALQKAAVLFRAFGEDYHEKKLEEAYIFPAVKRLGGEVARLAEILPVQHQRGRDITDYVLSVTGEKAIRANQAEQLARALESLVRMYRPHAAREDTIVFPAWKQTLTAKQLDEMNDTFEDIEHRQFGEDGFENAVRQIGAIEAELGLADVAAFTAPAAPLR